MSRRHPGCGCCGCNQKICPDGVPQVWTATIQTVSCLGANNAQNVTFSLFNSGGLVNATWTGGTTACYDGLGNPSDTITATLFLSPDSLGNTTYTLELVYQDQISKVTYRTYYGASLAAGSSCMATIALTYLTGAALYSGTVSIAPFGSTPGSIEYSPYCGRRVYSLSISGGGMGRAMWFSGSSQFSYSKTFLADLDFGAALNGTYTVTSADDEWCGWEYTGSAQAGGTVNNYSRVLSGLVACQNPPPTPDGSAHYSGALSFDFSLKLSLNVDCKSETGQWVLSVGTSNYVAANTGDQSAVSSVTTAFTGASALAHVKLSQLGLPGGQLIYNGMCSFNQNQTTGAFSAS